MLQLPPQGTLHACSGSVTAALRAWGTEEVLKAVVEHVPLNFIQQMEQEGGYLPAEDHPSWTSTAVVMAAASCMNDRAAKLRWLAARGAVVEGFHTVEQAEEWLAQLLEQGSASRVSAFLHGLDVVGEILILSRASRRGSFAMLWRLLQVGYVARWPVASNLLHAWPAQKPDDSWRLGLALGLLAGAGWPLVEDAGQFDALADLQERYTTEICRRHPWPVWSALVDAVPVDARHRLRRIAAVNAADTGCEATLEALAALPAWEEYTRDLAGTGTVVRRKTVTWACSCV